MKYYINNKELIKFDKDLQRATKQDLDRLTRKINMMLRAFIKEYKAINSNR